MTTSRAREIIEEVQSGELDRRSFPEEMKGQFAKDDWYDGIFSLGMEYGVILGMLFVIEENNKNEQSSVL